MVIEIWQLKNCPKIKKFAKMREVLGFLQIRSHIHDMRVPISILHNTTHLPYRYTKNVMKVLMTISSARELLALRDAGFWYSELMTEDPWSEKWSIH